MADLILQSNEASALLRTLNNGEKEDLSYGIKLPYPILTVQHKNIIPNQGSGTIANPAGATFTFNTNKSQLWNGMQIRSVLTASDTANSLTTPHGLTLFDSIEIRSNNKVIFTQSDAYTFARSQNSPIHVVEAIHRRALPMDSTTHEISVASGSWTSGAVAVFTPVFCPFFESTEQSFDLNFYEQIQVVCRVNTTARMNLTNSLTAMSCSAWVDTWVPDLKDYEELRSKNQNPSRPLTMLTYNTYTERFTPTSDTVNTVKLGLNYPVANMYFYMRNTTLAATAGTAAYLATITSFDFSVGGTKVYESMPPIVANYNSELRGACPIIPTSGTAVSRLGVGSRIVCLPFGLKPHDRTMNTGAVSFAQINTPTLTINTPTGVTAANFEIVVCSEYWNLLTLDATGIVSISLSN